MSGIFRSHSVDRWLENNLDRYLEEQEDEEQDLSDLDYEYLNECKDVK